MQQKLTKIERKSFEFIKTACNFIISVEVSENNLKNQYAISLCLITIAEAAGNIRKKGNKGNNIRKLEQSFPSMPWKNLINIRALNHFCFEIDFSQLHTEAIQCAGALGEIAGLIEENGSCDRPMPDFLSATSIKIQSSSLRKKNKQSFFKDEEQEPSKKKQRLETGEAKSVELEETAQEESKQEKYKLFISRILTQLDNINNFIISDPAYQQALRETSQETTASTTTTTQTSTDSQTYEPSSVTHPHYSTEQQAYNPSSSEQPYYSAEQQAYNPSSSEQPYYSAEQQAYNPSSSEQPYYSAEQQAYNPSSSEQPYYSAEQQAYNPSSLEQPYYSAEQQTYNPSPLEQPYYSPSSQPYSYNEPQENTITFHENTIYAIEMGFVIITNEIKEMSQQFFQEYPLIKEGSSVEWSVLLDLGNSYIHNYYIIDSQDVCNFSFNKIQSLIQAVQAIEQKLATQPEEGEKSTFNVKAGGDK